jgi:hypothetical protein
MDALETGLAIGELVFGEDVVVSSWMFWGLFGDEMIQLGCCCCCCCCCSCLVGDSGSRTDRLGGELLVMGDLDLERDNRFDKSFVPSMEPKLKIRWGDVGGKSLPFASTLSKRLPDDKIDNSGIVVVGF